MLSGRGVAIAAVAEISAPRRNAAARAVPAARLYQGHGELLAREKDLDALIVSTPPLYHADAVLAGLRAGLHVLCEKPLTLDAPSLALIAAESRARDRAAYTVNNWAYAPQWEKLIGLVRAGTLGAVRTAEIRVHRTKPSVSAVPGDWRKDPAVSGGGILVDHGWHNLYLLRALLGPELELKRTELKPAGGVDQEAAVYLSTGSAAGSVELSWRAAERANTAFVMGERGTAALQDDRIVVKAGGREETFRFAEKLSAGSAHPEWLNAMWPAFEAECAGEGRGASLAEAEFCLKVIRAAYGAGEAARA